MPQVTLTDAELVLLDGRVGQAAQAEIDAAKRREAMRVTLADVSPAIAGFVADVVAEAERKGRLAFYAKRLSHCQLCGKSGTYAKYKRSGRQHRAGDLDYSRPINLSGYELAERFVTFQGFATLGCCAACWAQARTPVVAALASVRAEVPERLTGHPPVWKRHDHRHCTSCDWRGHEGEMRWERTIMGDGRYPARCPTCGAGGDFSSTVERVEGWTLVAVEDAKVVAC